MTLFPWLWLVVRMNKKESYDPLENFFSYVHCTVDAIRRFRPVHFANRNRRLLSLAAVAELDAQQMAAQHHQIAALEFVLVLEQTARRRAGSAAAVFIERAAVAWTHEQPRCLKPANRAAEVSTIDRENLERL